MTRFQSNLQTRVTKKHPRALDGYEQQPLSWLLMMDGKQYRIVLNGPQKGIEGFVRTRFARKHLLLPSLKGAKIDGEYVANKMVNRLDHRKNPEGHHLFKYGFSLVGDRAKNTVINLVDQGEFRFVEEKEAAVKFASAGWDFSAKSTAKQRVRVDFNCACVLTQSHNREGKPYTQKQKWANLEGRAVVAGDWYVIVVEHLDTKSSK